MNLQKTINKYLYTSIIFLILIFIYFEGIMGLKAHYYQEYRNNRITSSFMRDFQQIIFSVSCIALLILLGYNIIKIREKIGKTNVGNILKYGLIFYVILAIVTGSCINNGNLMDFYEENIWLYRLIYLLVGLPFMVLIYELTINKSQSIFPNLKYSKVKDKINVDSNELDKLKSLDIIDKETYSTELQKIKKEKVSIEIKNTEDYKEFENSVNIALSKDLITKEVAEEKLLKKENELFEKHYVNK
ncbi:hypothetical protein [Tenacibaculum finnmarkense]|uniref:hypothetical protein n=1 Tax=Tenacibaculum finnmarkense TaxID=2781243 RepID=UPI001EFB1360|nr:hypothetical protein [Tenacibaculum finnmarkense]MCG8748165.1 hypothetical protein [Tenacibaculum finnmarkense]MCG8753931.1 hypothetical protein [Tenacibaculum finnmarkense]MCG8781825.1 hypothetical protein [Tenacibaculum finnmarkense]